MAAPTPLTVQQAPAFARGVAVVAQTPDIVNGNVYANGLGTVLTVNNLSGSPITITFTLPASNRNLGVAGTEVITIPATTEMCFGVMENGAYNNSLGQVQFLLSSLTTVTAKVVQSLPTPI